MWACAGRGFAETSTVAGVRRGEAVSPVSSVSRVSPSAVALPVTPVCRSSPVDRGDGRPGTCRSIRRESSHRSSASPPDPSPSVAGRVAWRVSNHPRARVVEVARNHRSPCVAALRAARSVTKDHSPSSSPHECPCSVGRKANPDESATVPMRAPTKFLGTDPVADSVATVRSRSRMDYPAAGWPGWENRAKWMVDSPDESVCFRADCRRFRCSTKRYRDSTASYRDHHRPLNAARDSTECRRIREATNPATGNGTTSNRRARSGDRRQGSRCWTNHRSRSSATCRRVESSTYHRRHPYSWRPVHRRSHLPATRWIASAGSHRKGSRLLRFLSPNATVYSSSPKCSRGSTSVSYSSPALYHYSSRSDSNRNHRRFPHPNRGSSRNHHHRPRHRPNRSPRHRSNHHCRSHPHRNPRWSRRFRSHRRRDRRRCSYRDVGRNRHR